MSAPTAAVISALRFARNQVVAFAILQIGADAAVKAVEYIDTALSNYDAARQSQPADAAAPTPADGHTNYNVTALTDLSGEINKLPAEFPNYADWSVTLPAGHWRAIFNIPLTAKPSTPAPVMASVEERAKAHYFKRVTNSGQRPTPPTWEKLRPEHRQWEIDAMRAADALAAVPAPGGAGREADWQAVREAWEACDKDGGADAGDDLYQRIGGILSRLASPSPDAAAASPEGVEGLLDEARDVLAELLRDFGREPQEDMEAQSVIDRATELLQRLQSPDRKDGEVQS